MAATISDLDDCIQELWPLLIRAARISADCMERDGNSSKDVEERWKALFNGVVDELQRYNPRSGARLSRWSKLLRLW